MINFHWSFQINSRWNKYLICKLQMNRNKFLSKKLKNKEIKALKKMKTPHFSINKKIMWQYRIIHSN
jgi:hypothetical protein